MKYRSVLSPFSSRPNCHPGESGSARASALYLVDLQELQQLRLALERGILPADFDAKLGRLAGSQLGHHFIEQHSRLFILLLLAAREGAFLEATTAQREKLLRVLAYVRKDDDAIPDPRSDGFVDDLHEVRAVSRELAPLLTAFKHWRLEHQVPVFWQSRELAGQIH